MEPCHYCKSHPLHTACHCKTCGRYDPIGWIFNNITVHPNGCWLLTKGIDKGRGYVRINMNGRRVMAHRWSYELHHGQIPEGLDVLHSCIDARNCINPLHLRAGTDTENGKDKSIQGRVKKWIPKEINLSKYTQDQVIEIREMLKTMKPPKISKLTGMSSRNIRDIRDLKIWKVYY